MARRRRRQNPRRAISISEGSSEFGPAGGFIPFQGPGQSNPFAPPDLLSTAQRDKLQGLREKRKSGEDLSRRERRQLGNLRGLKQEERQIRNQGFDLRTPQGALAAAFQAAGATGNLQSFFNRLGQENPFGSRQFITDPVTGQTRVVDSLNQANQGTLSGLQQQGNTTLAQLQQALGQGFSTQGAPAVRGIDDFAGERQRIEQDLFNRFESLNAERFAKERENLMTELSQRGIPVGSELFNKQLQELENTQNRSREEARVSATQLAGAEQARLFEGQLQGRNQFLGESQLQRSLPLQELGQLLALQGGVPQTNFGGISQVGVPNIDVAGTALGFGSLFSGADLANRQLAQQKELGLAQLAKQSGPTDPFALAKFQEDLRRGTLTLQNQLEQGNKPRTPSTFEQIAGGLAPGIGAGIGAGIGGLF